MKKILIFTVSLLFGSIVVFINIISSKKINISDISIFLLIALLLFLNPILEHLFPSLKEMGIGSLKFYPNLLKKILKKKILKK